MKIAKGTNKGSSSEQISKEEMRGRVGKRIAAARAVRELFQEELGQMVDKSQESISQYEGGTHEADYLTIFRLAKALRVEVSDLIKP